MQNEVKERPIRFKAHEVRAILSGAKTQTRRVVSAKHLAQIDTKTLGRHVSWSKPMPFGQPGDRLWVRETWMDLTGTGVEHRDMETGKKTRYAYGAESPRGSASDEARKDFGLKWRPSIHMPRDACRLVLEITDVRVERLQALPESDWEAEGISFCMEDPGTAAGSAFNEAEHYAIAGVSMRGTPEDHGMRAQFAEQGLDWDANPWVWVIGFKQVQP